MSYEFSNDEFDLLKLFLNNSNLTLEQISFFLKKSFLTSQKKISKINSFLKLLNLGKIKKNGSFYFLILNENYLDNLLHLKKSNNSISSQERINYITILLIFEDNITLSSLVPLFNITFGTLTNDLRKLKLFLKKFNLQIISTPWQGIKLKGSPNEIFSFSIQFLTKYFIEQEFNIISKFIYNLYINPYINNYFEEKLKKFDFNKLNFISNEIIKNFNLNFNIFFKTSLKSTFIYLYLNKEFKFEFKFNNLYTKIVRHVS